MLSCSIERDGPFPDGYTLAISDKTFQDKATYFNLTTTEGFKLLLLDDNGPMVDQAIFQYSIHQFHASDVNRDGQTDILIGLTKSTRFDPGVKFDEGSGIQLL